MASSGKKGKKSKGTAISLQSFLSDGNDAPIGTTQVSKKVRNFDGDDSDDGGTSFPLVFQLPTAPRANRIFEDDSIPYKPPFLAFVTNLPFEANEDDIYDFFGAIPIISLRLPREDGENGRVRGFGYVEFDTRDDLIHVLSLPDPTIKGRKIRIDLSNENDLQGNRQRSNRRGYDGFGNNGENRESTNWRRDNQNQDTSSYERGYNRDRKTEISQDSGAPGSWRTGSRTINDSSPLRGNFIGERHRDGNNRNRSYDNDRERARGAYGADEESAQERPKLNLKPRTLPLPEAIAQPGPETVDSAELNCNEEENSLLKKISGSAPLKVFGAAKPVDTASRELEIEERLAQSRRDEKLKQEQKQKEIDVNEKFSEIQLEKPDKENANSAISWRCRDQPSSVLPEDVRSNCQDKKDIVRRNNDERRVDNKEFNCERVESFRTEQLRDKLNQNRNDKQKDDSKLKRDLKIECPPQKLQHQSGLVMQTSNKYSGLDDEASD